MIGGLYGLGGMLKIPVKRKVFVSYHHAGDQHYYDAFSKFFCETYDVFHDKSLDRAYESDNTDYVRWQIRQNDISGSSCTIVLCGAATHQRKYVDWEIKATLDKGHGLIGVWLPTLPLAPNGGTEKPARLQDNIDSGYAQWVRWDALTVEVMKMTIEAAIASPARLIRNQRALRVRNG
jgi:antiphage defense system Thoeris ThsB-like protein